MYLLDPNVVSELRKPKPHGAVLAWFEAIEDTQLHLSAVTIVRSWARLMHRKSVTVNEDAMIAATAKVHGLMVVTRNVADFKAFGVPLLNPFKA